MRDALDLLRARGARRFFLAHTQSSIGTGAGEVAILVIAYDRFESPWALALVLLAEFVPAMALGPVFGAAADRWSRRWCAIVADAARALAFVGIALVGSFEATVGLALLAGAGAGLYVPAILAGLPSMVPPERLPAATSVYGAITDLGRTAGPALAALLLLFASAEVVAVVNGATFAVSALALATLAFGRAPAAEPARPSLLRQAREGISATMRMRGIRVLIVASSAMTVFTGMTNVAELLFARELGAGASAFSALVAVWGAGFVAGSLAGAGDRPLPRVKRSYVIGLFVHAFAFLALSVVPALALAFVGFALAGYGNGVMLVSERVLTQRSVADALMARVFAANDTLNAWAFAVAFVAAGAMVSLLGTRETFAIAGAGGLVVWAVAAIALRDAWSERAPAPRPAEPAAVPSRPTP